MAQATSEQIRGALQECAVFRAKHDHIPVYQEADATSGTVHTLKVGEKVCHIGERKRFAIVDWSKQELINGTSAKIPPVESQRLVFVKLTDLWEPSHGGYSLQDPLDVTGRAKGYLDGVQNGVVNEDVLYPFRPFLDLFNPEPECTAGKICDKVMRDLKKEEKK